MRDFVTSGRVIDVILSVVVVEALVLVVLSRARGAAPTPKGFSALDVIGQLLAGFLLLIAVRCALTGADYRWTVVFLTASLPAHLYDLARRSRSLTQVR